MRSARQLRRAASPPPGPMTPPSLPANLPAEVRLAQETPTEERTVWIWHLRLLGDTSERGLPLYEYGDDILIRMRKEGVRPQRRRFLLRVPGRKPAEEAGDDLQELVDRVLTQDTLLRYVDYLVERYSRRLSTKLLRDAGLYSYALSL